MRGCPAESRGAQRQHGHAGGPRRAASSAWRCAAGQAAFRMCWYRAIVASDEQACSCMAVLQKAVVRSVSTRGGTPARSIISMALRCWSGRIQNVLVWC